MVIIKYKIDVPIMIDIVILIIFTNFIRLNIIYQNFQFTIVYDFSNSYYLVCTQNNIAQKLL